MSAAYVLFKPHFPNSGRMCTAYVQFKPHFPSPQCWEEECRVCFVQVQALFSQPAVLGAGRMSTVDVQF
jgi:hypothetical protein